MWTDSILLYCVCRLPQTQCNTKSKNCFPVWIICINCNTEPNDAKAHYDYQYTDLGKD
jgi:hypothetical protein